MTYAFAKLDDKRRIYLSKELQREYGLDGDVVRIEKRKDALLILKRDKADGFTDLMELGEKFKGLKGKTPLQLKREAQERMAKELGS